MRTTLRIDDDVLSRARQLADDSGRSIGQVISDLSRTALNASPGSGGVRNGIVLLPDSGHGRQATLDDVNRLRDEVA